LVAQGHAQGLHRWAQPAGGGPDPDQNLYNLYGCGGDLNYNGSCNPAVGKLIDQQSAEADQEIRKKLVWEIERKLAEDGARPIIFYDRRATCWQPRVKGLTIMVNSISNGARMEDVWLDISRSQPSSSVRHRELRWAKATPLRTAPAPEW
jgi:ABC-type transport system substrate-binding protein